MILDAENIVCLPLLGASWRLVLWALHTNSEFYNHGLTDYQGVVPIDEINIFRSLFHPVWPYTTIQHIKTQYITIHYIPNMNALQCCGPHTYL
jgi:hypothetical protein